MAGSLVVQDSQKVSDELGCSLVVGKRTILKNSNVAAEGDNKGWIPLRGFLRLRFCHKLLSCCESALIGCLGFFLADERSHADFFFARSLVPRGDVLEFDVDGSVLLMNHHKVLAARLGVMGESNNFPTVVIEVEGTLASCDDVAEPNDVACFEGRWEGRLSENGENEVSHALAGSLGIDSDSGGFLFRQRHGLPPVAS